MASLKIAYLSGRITDNRNYKDDFKCAELFLSEMQYAVLNPAKISDELPNLTDEEYRQICYRLIDIADTIFMVSGWQKSKGANAELAYAKSLGKKVMYQDYYAPFRKVGESDE